MRPSRLEWRAIILAGVLAVLNFLLVLCISRGQRRYADMRFFYEKAVIAMIKTSIPDMSKAEMAEMVAAVHESDPVRMLPIDLHGKLPGGLTLNQDVNFGVYKSSGVWHTYP